MLILFDRYIVDAMKEGDNGSWRGGEQRLVDFSSSRNGQNRVDFAILSMPKDISIRVEQF